MGIVSVACCAARAAGVRRDDDVNPKSGQFGRLIYEPLDLAICCSVLNKDVLAFHIAEFMQSLPEGIDHHHGLGKFKRPRRQEANSWNFLRLLSPRHHRPRRRPAQCRDQLAPPHAILPNGPGR
jgi:hypothetical protein